jgi:hypothetical protein
MIDTSGRIQIKAVRVIGANKPPAEVSFAQGFNVISGASNTGKSYILQCIEYGLGAGKTPKHIEESVGYESVQLDFVSGGDTFTLERSLKGGDARIFGTDATGSPLPPRFLAEEHSPTDPNTISGFLLQHTGFWNKRVRTSKSGELRSLSFRDLADLIIVDESKIISDASPLLTGQYTSKTAERSVFNLLLSGVDDSSIIAVETKLRECEAAMLETTEEPQFSSTMISESVEYFTLEVQHLLESWSYPDLTRVTFSEADADLIISGRRRATEGKGLRAISYGGFVIGLMNYCRRGSRSHPGFVVLDSPLVTYKKKDIKHGEAIPDDVKSAFFSVLSKMPPNMQVIVLENEDPPEEIRASLHYQHFSRSEIGRYGFFPRAARQT